MFLTLSFKKEIKGQLLINSLDLQQKQQLLEILEQQIFEEEEASYQDDEETLAQLQKVRDEYQSGDYVTLELSKQLGIPLVKECEELLAKI